MAKSAICGKSTLFNGSVKLSDAVICGVCFKRLGFSITDAYNARNYTLADIQRGKDSPRQVDNIRLVHEPDIDCTVAERKVYEIISDVIMDTNKSIDPARFDLERDPDGSLVMLVYGSELARYKAVGDKWVQFPSVSPEKLHIKKPEDVEDFTLTIIAATDKALKRND